MKKYLIITAVTIGLLLTVNVAHSQSDAYLEYFANHPMIADSSINTFDQETLDYFWTYIDELESTGAISIEEPSESQDCVEPDDCWYIVLTDTEVKRILAAKTAHSIWLDKNNMLPWKLEDYSEDELAGLFDKSKLFDYSSNLYWFEFVVDYSPSDVYSYVTDNDLISTDILNTVHAVVDDVRTTDSKTSFVHGSSYYDPVDTAYTLYYALTTYEDREGYESQVRVSRMGCHSMSRILVGILRSINIPGEVTDSGEWFETNHASAAWQAIQRVLPHGDNVYNRALAATPVEELLTTFEFYNDEQNTEVCAADKDCLSHRHMSLLIVTYPANYTVERCCNPSEYGYVDCEDYLSDLYGAYLTTEEITNATAEILNLCPDVTLDVGPGYPYTSIQDAIDDAGEGDTVLVHDGTYYENIDFLYKAITVQSENGPFSTTISGNVSGQVVTISSSGYTDQVLHGFTITNGSTSGIFIDSSYATISNCIISGNSAVYGGGIASFGGTDYSSPTIINCTISGNSAQIGGGIASYFTAPTIINCTISGNSASSGGGIASQYYSVPTVVNSIFWGNTPDEIYLDGGDIDVTYSDIDGGWAGTGNIDADPLFVDQQNGDYHLSAGSPCIDAGTSEGAPPYDIDWESRPQGPDYDMGSDEYVFPSCPVLYSWNGENFVYEDHTFYRTHSPEEEYDHIVPIRAQVVPKEDGLVFKIVETEGEKSFINKVELYFTEELISAKHMEETIDNCEADTNMFRGVSSIDEVNGTELALTSAVHSVLGDVSERLTEDDESRVEIFPGEEILLTFENPAGGTAPQYLFVARGYYLFGEYKRAAVVTPANIDFGSVEVGNSGTAAEVTISNTKDIDLTVSAISEPGAPFSLDRLPALPIAIPAGGSETFVISFSPTAEGDFSRTVSVSTEDGNQPEVDVLLSGTGVTSGNVSTKPGSGGCFIATACGWQEE